MDTKKSDLWDCYSVLYNPKKKVYLQNFSVKILYL